MSSLRSSASSLLPCLALAAVLLAPDGASAQDEEASGWTGELNLNVANQTGTTDTFQGSLNANLAREWEQDTLTARAKAAYGETLNRQQEPPDSQQTEITQNAQSLGLDWQHRFDERYFWGTGTVGSRDTVQDINFRYVVDSGPGYRVWMGEDVSKRHLDVNVAVGYRFVHFRGGEEDDLNLVDLIAGFEYMNLVFDDRLEIRHTGKLLLPANEIDAWAVNTEIVFGVPITASWSMRVGFEFDYQNFTPPRVNKIKTVTSVGIGYQF